MFEVSISDELIEKYRAMVAEEGDDACVRIREYKLGGGCRTRVILGLGMEEMDEDEDERIEVKGLPFIIEKDLLLRYGKKFGIAVEDDTVIVTPLEPVD